MNVFNAANTRLAALVLKHEGVIEIEITPRATIIERIRASVGDQTAEVLALTLEECK
jgi:hypothetical protein